MFFYNVLNENWKKNQKKKSNPIPPFLTLTSAFEEF